MSSRLYAPLREARRPVYIGAMETYTSYSGQDARATAYVNGQVFELGSLYTLSYSTFRDIIPVRGLGRAAPLGHARGYRTIAGSFVFNQWNKDSFFDMISTTEHDRSASGPFPTLSDQIPAFNLTVVFSGETSRQTYAPAWRYDNPQNRPLEGAEGASFSGHRFELVGSDPIQTGSILILYRVTLGGQGSTISVDDMITEAVFNWHALGISPLRDTFDPAMFGPTMPDASETDLLVAAKGQNRILSSNQPKHATHFRQIS